MKDQKKINDGVSSSSSTPSSSTTTNNNTNNFNLLLRRTIRKNNNHNGGPHVQDLLILRRLKEYFLYSKLKSLIPPQPFDAQYLGIRQDIHGGNEEELATEVEMELNEIPAERDSDEEIDHNIREPADNHTTTSSSSSSSSSMVGLKNVKLVIERKVEKEDDEEDENEHTIVEFESDDDDEEEERENGSSLLKPFVPSIKIQKMEDIIIIRTIVLKEVALTSALFRILEEEKLDIVSENQYRPPGTKVCHTIKVNVEPEYTIDELEKKLQKWARSS